MTKRLIFTLTIALQLTNAVGQDLPTQLKNNAVRMEHLDKLEKPVLDKLKDFRIIMIGEMHGTNEPATFLIGLTELFTYQGDTVQVGFEIPSELMSAYNSSLTDSSVFNSEFFSIHSVDGRASSAWANAIIRLTKNSKAQVFFFDNNQSQSRDYQDRDSLMYVKLKQKIMEHPNWRTITLSGNIHNMRLKYKDQPTAAYYLCNDKELGLTDRVCTLTHYYQSGTMLNNMGSGLELRQVNNNPSVFSETLDFDNYIFLFPTPNTYNGLFFTRTVTASMPTAHP
jgi:hypothetical protein